MKNWDKTLQKSLPNEPVQWSDHAGMAWAAKVCDRFSFSIANRAAQFTKFHLEKKLCGTGDAIGDAIFESK